MKPPSALKGLLTLFCLFLIQYSMAQLVLPGDFIAGPSVVCMGSVTTYTIEQIPLVDDQTAFASVKWTVTSHGTSNLTEVGKIAHE